MQAAMNQRKCYSPAERIRLRELRSCNGKYEVIFVHQPEYAEYEAFFVPPYAAGENHSSGILYINMDAFLEANIIAFTTA